MIGPLCDAGRRSGAGPSAPAPRSNGQNAWSARLLEEILANEEEHAEGLRTLLEEIGT
jgi:hypothetical protein